MESVVVGDQRVDDVIGQRLERHRVLSARALPCLGAAQRLDARLACRRFIVTDDHGEFSATAICTLELRLEAASARMQHHIQAYAAQGLGCGERDRCGTLALMHDIDIAPRCLSGRSRLAQQLEQALDTFGGTVLLVTHDRSLLESVRITRTITMENGQMVLATC